MDYFVATLWHYNTTIDDMVQLLILEWGNWWDAENARDAKRDAETQRTLRSQRRDAEKNTLAE